MDRLLQTLVDRIDVSRNGISVQPAGDSGEALELLSSRGTDDLQRLSAYLYAHYYAGDPSLCEDGASDYLSLMGLRHSNVAFLRTLEASNPGSGYWSNGWRIARRRTTGQLEVERAGISIVVEPQRHLREGAVGNVDDSVAVRFPKDGLMASPGFYVAYANSGPANDEVMTRLYLSLTPTFAAAVTYGLLSSLLELGVPYTFKMLADPTRYARRDTAVLYISRSDYSLVAPVAVECRRRFEEGFRRESPGFTRQMLPGLAVADEPIGANGMSFGQHRVWILAEALFQIAEQERPSADLHEAVAQEVSSSGLDPARMHLAHARAPDYEM